MLLQMRKDGSLSAAPKGSIFASGRCQMGPFAGVAGAGSTPGRLRSRLENAGPVSGELEKGGGLAPG